MTQEHTLTVSSNVWMTGEVDEDHDIDGSSYEISDFKIIVEISGVERDVTKALSSAVIKDLEEEFINDYKDRAWQR